MTPDEFAAFDATGLAAAIRERRCSAREVTDAAFATIRDRNPALNCFTALTAQRAIDAATAADNHLAARGAPPPFLGVPFGVKNLYDIAGLPTVAGSEIRRAAPPATCDAAAVAALERAGMILCGALNMDEFAYGFVTENAHDGPTRNPWDLSRIAGGSSGGSAAAVAAGLLPLTLGTDTNGSIRVPASLCGVFGLKPTYGRLSRAGVYPFVDSLDCVGPFARSVRDLALALDCLGGHEATGPMGVSRPPEPVASIFGQGIGGMRIAVLAGHFAGGADPAAFAVVEEAARVLNATRRVTLPEAALARSAAYLITAAEGGSLHLPELRTRAGEFDPETRDRLLAGALLPTAWYLQAQRFRSWFRARVREVFDGTAGQGERVDVLLAPATPCQATAIGQQTVRLAGTDVPVRANLGLFTQPISFVGLPVVCVPAWPGGTAGAGLPIGVQVIAAAGRDGDALRVAAVLEASGFASAPVAKITPSKPAGSEMFSR